MTVRYSSGQPVNLSKWQKDKKRIGLQEEGKRIPNGWQKDRGRVGSQKDSRRMRNEYQMDGKRIEEGLDRKWIADGYETDGKGTNSMIIFFPSFCDPWKARLCVIILS